MHPAVVQGVQACPTDTRPIRVKRQWAVMVPMVLLTGLLHATDKLRTPIALAEAADSSVSWDFDAEPLGVLPKGFVVGTLFDGRPAGEWTVHDMKQLPGILKDMDRRESARIKKLIEALAAPSPLHVLAQLMNKGFEHDYKVVLVDGTTATDLELEVSFLAVAGKGDMGGGLIWRAKSPLLLYYFYNNKVYHC